MIEKLLRTFIAIPTPVEVRSKKNMLYSTLEDSPATINWVKNMQLHLTIKFLGHTPESTINKIVEDVENCILYALSEWESHSHYDDYVAWRLENGLGDLLDQYLIEGLQGFKPHKVIETNM